MATKKEIPHIIQEEQPRIFGVYESVQGCSDAVKGEALKALRKEVGDEEFERQLLLFVEHIREEQRGLQHQIKEIKKTPNWQLEPWIKLSEVCGRLYETNDDSTVEVFNRKRLGLQPWLPEELERLEQIRQELAERLVTSLP